VVTIGRVGQAECLQAPSEMNTRRFPPPWSVEEPDPKLARQWCYIVRDANGHALAYIYFEDETPAGDRPPG
jgi:hypothetical protein